MKQDLSDKRKDYSLYEIDFNSVPASPFVLFEQWYNQVQNAGLISEPYAMSISAIEPDGFPRTRVVLLKEFNSDGFIFYTNYNSRKGKSIEHNSKVCLSFFWDKFERQVIIKGIAEKVVAEKSDAYFLVRPFESQIGAIVSNQSAVIDFNHNLQDDVFEFENKLKGKEVTRPENWGGFLVRPIEIEFWQGRPSRLHDRLNYRLEKDNWLAERLSP